MTECGVRDWIAALVAHRAAQASASQCPGFHRNSPVGWVDPSLGLPRCLSPQWEGGSQPIACQYTTRRSAAVNDDLIRSALDDQGFIPAQCLHEGFRFVGIEGSGEVLT